MFKFQVSASLRSARNFVESNAQQVWQTVASSGELAFPQRIDIRMAATFALQEAKLVADVTWEIAVSTQSFHPACSSAASETSARSCSFAQGRKAHAYLLGLEPSLAFA